MQPQVFVVITRLNHSNKVATIRELPLGVRQLTDADHLHFDRRSQGDRCWDDVIVVVQRASSAATASGASAAADADENDVLVSVIVVCRRGDSDWLCRRPNLGVATEAAQSRPRGGVAVDVVVGTLPLSTAGAVAAVNQHQQPTFAAAADPANDQ